MAVAGELDSRADVNQAGGESAFWQTQLDLAERDHKDYQKAGQDVVDRYKSESKITANRSDRKKFNILFSNTEVLKAAMFARMAKPDVRRRFSDPDPMGRQIAELVERTLIATNDTGGAQREVMAAVEDYVLPGRGIVRIRYEAQTSMHPETGQEYVSQQDVWDEHILWKNFRHEPAETWSQVTWLSFKQLMTKDDLHANFDDSLGFEAVEKIPLNYQPDTYEKKKLEDAFRKAEVWEVWDKVMRQRLWIVKGFDKVLRKDADPYGLEEFFPMPEPMQAVTTNDSFVPQPEFMIYKDQADGLDEIEARIDRITKALKRRGIRNAKFEELKRVGTASDNEFVPVSKWDELQSGGGMAKQYEAEDIRPLVNVLAELANQRELRKQTIYEVIGIADIMRGVSNPNETLGAQQLKAKFGSDRLKKRQDRVQEFVRDLLRLKAEIIAEHYEPQKLAEMSGFQWIPTAIVDPSTGKEVIPAPPAPPQMDPQTGQMMPPQPQPPQPVPDNSITPQMIKILRTDRLRSYRIDIETDSTIYEDEEAEKQARTELLTAMSQFVGAWLPIIQAEPKLLTLAMAMLEFGVRGFKSGRELEETIEQTKQQLEQAAEDAANAPPQQSPEAIKAQSDQQIQQMKQQHEAQLAQAQQAHEQAMAQRQAEADQQSSQSKAALAAHQAQIKAMQDDHQAKLKAMMDGHKAELANAKDSAALQQADRHHKDKMDLERAKARAAHHLAVAAHNKALIDPESADGMEAPPGPLETMSSTFSTMQEGMVATLGHLAQSIFDIGEQVKKTNDGIKQIETTLVEMEAQRSEPIEAVRDKSGRLTKVKQGARVLNITRDAAGKLKKAVPGTDTVQ